jgi:hypothetical protein
MKNNQSLDNGPLHQTVADGFEFKTGGKGIAVEFTDQKLSAHAGSAPFWAWVHGTGWARKLEEQLPHRRAASNNHLTALEKAMAFTHGLLCEARKLTHIAYFRRDPVVPELLAIRRVASQSGLSRFFKGFASACANLRCFRPIWRWCVERLPSRREGYTLDLDSTRLLHEDGHQEGVHVGYSRSGFKPCLNPLLAVLAEARLVVQLWLRSGDTVCCSDVVAFFLDLLDQLPRHVRLRAVRADSGFCVEELLKLWEQMGLPYIVVGRLTVAIQHLIRRDTVWTPTELAGTDAAEVEHHGLGWSHPRRLILIRHRLSDWPGAGGKKTHRRARLRLPGAGNRPAQQRIASGCVA